MKHKLLIFVPLTYLLSLIPYHSSGQTWQWVNGMGGPSEDLTYYTDQMVTGVGTDISGNVYVTGRVMPYASFGTYTVPNSYNWAYQGFLAAYDCSGNLKWVKTFGDNTSYTMVGGLAVDPSGNCYIDGEMDGGVHFGDTVVSPAYFYVAKYDSSGKLVWVNFSKTIADLGTGGISQGRNDIAINSAGTIITSGFNDVAGTVWPGINLKEGSFIAAFHPISGNALWATQIDTVYDLSIGDMKLNSNDDIYFAGAFNDSIHVGPYLLKSSQYGFHGCILKYNSNGILKWAKQDYSISNSSGFISMCVSGAAIYVEGQALKGDTIMGYPFNFSGIQIQGNFILKLDTSANLQWGIAQDSINSVYSGPQSAMTTDNSGNMWYTSGYGNAYDGVLKWGTYPSINSYSALDHSYNNCKPYLLELSPAGNLLSLTSLDTYADTTNTTVGGSQILFDNTGQMYVGGAYMRYMILANDTLADNWGNYCNLFIAKYGNVCSTTTAVDNVKTLPEINVYPNPARDKVTFESTTDLSGAHVQIYNVFGQLVQTFQLNPDVTSISMNNLSREFIYTGFVERIL